MTDDAMCTQRGQRNQAEDGRWAEDQLAGIAALISLAQSLKRAGEAVPRAPGDPAPGHDTLVGLPPVLEQQREEPRLSAGPVPRSAPTSPEPVPGDRGIVAVLSVLRNRVHQYGNRRGT
jgi:hypothetical protein